MAENFLACFILYSKAKFACYSRYLLTSYFCIPVPYDDKGIFLLLVLEVLVSLHRTVQPFNFIEPFNRSSSASFALVVGA